MKTVYNVGDLVVLGTVLYNPIFENKIGIIVRIGNYYIVNVIGGICSESEDYEWNVSANEIKYSLNKNLKVFI